MIDAIHTALVSYILIGLITGLAFVAKGAPAVSTGARGTGMAFRAVILPGAMLLWPFALWAWRRGRR